jgi:hypothetical protein
MTKTIITSIFSTAALALALVSPLSATTITVGGTSVLNEGVMSSVAGATTQTFDGLTSLPSGFTASGTTPANPLVHGSLVNVYASPQNDTSTYLTTGLGTITDTLAAGTDYFGVYWGSVDTYNTLTLKESNGQQVVINGDTLHAATGAIDNGTTSYYTNVFASPGVSFTSAVFASTNYAFEVDNVSSATPEPASLALFAGGLLTIAGVIRRKRNA